MSVAPLPRVVITLPPNQDPNVWRIRHEAGEIAGPWPYALNLLEHDFAVTPVVYKALSVGRLALLWFNLTTAPLRKHADRLRASDAECALSWDENLAIRSLAYVAAQKYVTGLIWITDDVVAGTRPFRKLLFRTVMRRFDGIFFSSRAQLSSAQEWLGNAQVRLAWIPMAVDPEFYPYYEYPSSPFVFSMGNDKHRDPHALAKALEMVVQKNPEIETLVQTNDPKAFPRIIETTQRLSAADVRRNYARASVVAVATQPNIHVSGVTVALEGMSSGRPVVMTGNPGLSDYVRDGETGFLTDHGDHEQFAGRILQIISDPDLGKQMGIAARFAVESDFNVQLMNDSIGRFISSILVRGQFRS